MSIYDVFSGSKPFDKAEYTTSFITQYHNFETWCRIACGKPPCIVSETHITGYK